MILGDKNGRINKIVLKIFHSISLAKYILPEDRFSFRLVAIFEHVYRVQLGEPELALGEYPVSVDYRASVSLPREIV